MIPRPRPQTADEPQHLYALELIRHVIAHGCATLTLDELRQADRFYPLVVWRLESTTTAERLAEARRWILKVIEAREASLAAWMDEYASQEEELTQADTNQEQIEPEELPPAERAIRLMRAALIEIMDGQGPQDDGRGPGSRVPVAPRPPKFPPSNAQAIPPTPPQPAVQKPPQIIW